MDRPVRVAVIGLGACGLVTLKNMIEAGFEATGFDRNEYIGGLWQYSKENSKVTVLESTITNVSKHGSCYTDFPFPEGVPEYPTALQVVDYLKSYAKNFDLERRMQFGVEIKGIELDGKAWRVHFSRRGNESTETYDKLAICTGSFQVPTLPNIEGLETFLGDAVHSSSFKNPEYYKGKKVIVVGLGNTGLDTAVSLVGTADKVYVSHRGPAAILPRLADGKPLDHNLTLRMVRFVGILSWLFPKLYDKLSANEFAKSQARAHKPIDIRPEWGLSPVPPLIRKPPVINDHFVSALHAGEAFLVPGISRISGSTVHLSDSSTLDNIDALIFSTGYKCSYTLAGPYDPSLKPPARWSTLPGCNNRPLPRLYQGLFSLDHPESLAFIGTSHFSPMANMNFDLGSMVVAQVWKGASSLPARAVMEKEVAVDLDLMCEYAASGPLWSIGYRNQWLWLKWADKIAGFGVTERMGYSWKAWKFWWYNRELYRLMVDGVGVPHIFRLFDEGKRPVWSGAQDALEKATAASKSIRSKSE